MMIYVNVASGSKIHAIGCMMACMMFDDREKIHPFYAQAEQYPEYDGTLQQTYGVAEVYIHFLHTELERQNLN